ncbi:hypothetical protein [Kitasatospora sp. A2-31]|uniref:hypothetical protein n=1 Tax=Kitasatospora sp. A2-31 TaxID=2916414 RepID=UPI001EEA751E|nr:hypothetical protein [Kitasatospora sp. A2-31]MCG6496982.1 hypothetical protein [Kitasatospora sp. A2-31]
MTGREGLQPLRFGWNYDLGEFVLAPRYPRPAVTRVLADTGFHLRSEPFGAWHMGTWLPMFEQSAAAEAAIGRLIAEGVEVRNWHEPQQGSTDVLRHYGWLNSAAPFPDAAETARRARSEAATRLGRVRLSSDTRAVTEQIARGEVEVEARRTFDDDEWMIAADRVTGRYLELRHHRPTGALSVTGDAPETFAGHLRREFRLLVLRETRPPTAARMRAARAASRVSGSRQAPVAPAPAPAAAAPARRR